MSKYVVAIFGNVATSTDYFLEKEVREISNTVASSTEITTLATDGYLKIFDTSSAANSFLATFKDTLAYCMSKETSLNKKNWENPPSLILDAIDTDADVATYQEAVTRYTANLSDATATQTAAATALAADTENTELQTAKATADTVVTVMTAKLATANSNLTAALAAQVTAHAKLA